jgi:hypothetical protein
MKKILQSDFLCGKNDRGWRADFDFFIKPETHIKIMEGKYDNRNGVKNRPMTHSEINEIHLREMYEKVERGEL